MKNSNNIKPLISVIVPVYNVEKYLSRCVDSLLRQTYSNLEVILVEDGTKDNSGRICDEYAQKDERVKVIHQQNKGLSGARNTGIDNANGEYIAFLDSDDYVSDKIYEKLQEYMQFYDADIVMCNYIRFSGGYCHNCDDKQVEVTKLDAKMALENIYSSDGESYTVAWNKLYKRSVIADIRYPQKRLNEDEFTTYKFFANANTIIYTNEILYYYFYNNDSITTKSDYAFNTDIYDALDERIVYLAQRGFDMFETKIQKQYLDRIINRSRKLWNINKTQTRKMHKLYKTRYKQVKGMVNSIGYKIYNITPTLYYAILDIKER
jgi:glycosyltransferase involved in cell wall biosynthesis